MISQLIRPQSQFLMKTLFQRDYDTMTGKNQKLVDKIVLAVDILVVIALIWWL
jgi:hypothetical protein